eukprot:Skav225134  [mRNA]  locus=scaffold1056:71938:92321:+ [translate_table: standard]
MSWVGGQLPVPLHKDSDLAIHNCTDFDCYETVKEVIKTGFSLGFAKGTEWHPAIHTVILFNEPDFFVNDPKCPERAAWCRVKAAISALDGLLAAEKEANGTGREQLKMLRNILHREADMLRPAVITGAAGNFGAVCARMMAAEGAKLALVDLVEDTVTKDANVEKTVADIKQEFGRIDCLFNNAGYQGLFAPVDDYSTEDFEKACEDTHDVLIHSLSRRKEGSIVNTASCAGLGCPTSMPAYGTILLRNISHSFSKSPADKSWKSAFHLKSRFRFNAHPGMAALRIWLVPLFWTLSRTQMCETGCSQDEVEALEERSELASLELLQVSLATQKAEQAETVTAPPEIIGCFGGYKPVSMGCENGLCTYRRSGFWVTFATHEVIGMDACSGGGCSWSCKNVLGCPQKPQMVGCDRMAPPLNHCNSGSNPSFFRGIWTCLSTNVQIKCPGSTEPRQDACSGAGCSFLC